MDNLDSIIINDFLERVERTLRALLNYIESMPLSPQIMGVHFFILNTYQGVVRLRGLLRIMERSLNAPSIKRELQ